MMTETEKLIDELHNALGPRECEDVIYGLALLRDKAIAVRLRAGDLDLEALRRDSTQAIAVLEILARLVRQIGGPK